MAWRQQISGARRHGTDTGTGTCARPLDHDRRVRRSRRRGSPRIGWRGHPNCAVPPDHGARPARPSRCGHVPGTSALSPAVGLR